MRYLFYHGLISPAGARNVETLLAVAMADGEAEVTLCLASGGGDVNAGIGLYNYIKMLPLKVHTHAAGPCGSIAATVFLAGEQRSAASLSEFMTHASTWADGPQKGQLSSFNDLMTQPFKDVLGWSTEDISARFSLTDMRYAPDHAKTLGIIDRIEDIRLGAGDTMVNVHIP